MANDTSSRPSFMRRALRRIAIVSGTALTGALAVGLVTVGSAYIAANASRVETPQAAPALPVATRPVTRSDSYDIPVRYTGQIEPDRTTHLAFEAGGTLAEVLVDEGDRVAAGAVIARLDTRAIDAEAAAQAAQRDALAAQLELARLTEARQSRLAAGGASSAQRADEARLTVAEIEARIRQIDAVLDGIAVATDKSVLRAPFAGRLGARLMDPGAQAAPGAPVAELLEDAAPRLRVGVPAAVASALTPDTPYDVQIDGQPYLARFDRARSDVDPVTRTVQAIFVIDGAGALPYGTLADLALTRRIDTPGIWIPTAALTEGARGIWSVMTVLDGPEGPVAAREAVEVLYANEARAFIRGPLSDGQPLITEGPHRVTPGQRVATGG